jgi:hypothetical protein
VQAALVDATGKVFWYWRAYERFLTKSGIPPARVAALRDAGHSKYDLMRELLDELDRAGESGYRVQLQLVRAMIAAPLNESDGIDMAAARDAQARLREAAQLSDMLPPDKDQQAKAEELAAIARRRSEAADRQAKRAAAEAKRAELFSEYCTLVTVTDVQGRGYRLEEMIGEVVALDGLRWTPPFRKETVTQTDGMITSEGFRYLVEARWRVEAADVQAVAALAHKASRNFSSTRGLFLSMAGFRPEVVRELETGDKNVLLMSGQDFALILEGKTTFPQALQLKVDEGAKKGHIFYDLTRASVV